MAAPGLLSAALPLSPPRGSCEANTCRLPSGPPQIHTYGIGLALTFWFAYRYFAKASDHGYPDAWFSRVFIWIVIASVIGARAVHVVANLRGAEGYAQNPGDILAIWHGGLSSYGGLLGGVPTGLICARCWCPQLRLGVALDLIAPVWSSPGQWVGCSVPSSCTREVGTRRTPGTAWPTPARSESACRCRSSRLSKT